MVEQSTTRCKGPRREIPASRAAAILHHARAVAPLAGSSPRARPGSWRVSTSVAPRPAAPAARWTSPRRGPHRRRPHARCGTGGVRLAHREPLRPLLPRAARAPGGVLRRHAPAQPAGTRLFQRPDAVVPARRPPVGAERTPRSDTSPNVPRRWSGCRGALAWSRSSCAGARRGAGDA